MVTPASGLSAVDPVQLAHALPDGVLLVDGEGYIRFANARICEMSGYTEAELTQRNVDSLVPAALREAHVKRRAAFAATPSVRSMGANLDIHLLCADGRELEVDIALSTIESPEGRMVLAAVRDATVRRAVERVRRENEQRLRMLEQRERLGRDLHDGVIQSMFAVGMRLQSVLTLTSDPEVTSRIDVAINELDDAIKDVRGYIFELGQDRTTASLEAELEQLCDDHRARTGMTTVLSVDGDALEALQPHANTVVMVTKEALSNVARHAGAATVRVTARCNGSAAELEIDDDGHGFDIDAVTAGLGIANARARATVSGGLYDVSSGPAGTTVLLAVESAG